MPVRLKLFSFDANRKHGTSKFKPKKYKQKNHGFQRIKTMEFHEKNSSMWSSCFRYSEVHVYHVQKKIHQMKKGTA